MNSSGYQDSEILDGDVPPVGSVEEQLAAASAGTRFAVADNTIKNHVMIAMTLGLVPLPLFDLALLIGNQATMVRALTDLYEQPFEEHRVKAIIMSLAGGSAPVLAVLGLSNGAKLIPGIGTLVGSGGVALAGGALTYGVGRVFVEHFESGGTLLNFDAKEMRESFKKAVETGRERFAKAAGKKEEKSGSV